MITFTLKFDFDVYDIFKKNMKEELDLAIATKLEEFIYDGYDGDGNEFNTILDYDDIDDSVKESFFNEDEEVIIKYIKPDMESLNFIGVHDPGDSTLYFEIDMELDIDRYIKNKGL